MVSYSNYEDGSVANATKSDSLFDGAQVWSLPCDTKISAAFSFDGQSFAVDEGQLVVRQADESCIGVVQAWPDEQNDNILLGSNFISAFYL